MPAFEASDDFIGTWSGRIETYEGPRPLQLWIGWDGDCRARIEGQLVTVITNPGLNGEFSPGYSMEIYKLPDTSRETSVTTPFAM